MNKLYIITPLLFVIFLTSTQCLSIHTFYALQNTDVVSQSQSVKAMNKCKDQCLQMKKYFPFKFKYHRYILRQKVGNNKYFQGTCHFSIPKEDKWYDWADLKIFIIDTVTMTDMSEVQRWSTFKDKCEDTSLRMQKDTLQGLGFQRVHSNFEYFDDGSFTNLQPFDDLNDLLGQVSGYLK